jgi:CheY-like chemotaxis protein
MVLVVEDDPDIREILVDELAAEGYEVVPAEHGEAALEAVSETSPCVVVTDLMMPHMDGATFIARLRDDPEFACVPIIVVTASAVSHVPGANLVFRKPFDLAELLQAVSRFAEPSGDGASPPI